MIKLFSMKFIFTSSTNTTKRAISHKMLYTLSTVKIDVTNEGITLIGSNDQISIENFISLKTENNF